MNASYSSRSFDPYRFPLPKSLWEWRFAIKLLVMRDFEVRYRRTFLGVIWSLLNPLLTSLILWIVFITIFRPRLPDGIDFAPFVLSGVLTVNFFTQGFTQVAESVANGRGIFRKVAVPPQVFAFSSAIMNCINFLMGTIALSLVAVITGNGISLFAPLILFFPITLMIFFITGLGLLASLAYLKFEDSRSIITIIIGFQMYLTPIFYPKEILSPSVLVLINLNPLTPFLDLFRFFYLGVGSFSIYAVLYSTVISILIFTIGVKYFNLKWREVVTLL